jgi:hypothetical protein
LNVGGRLAPDVAYELPDGGLVRWLGGFDLRHLARLAPGPVPLRELALRLRDEGLSDLDIDRLIEYCFSRNILG